MEGQDSNQPAARRNSVGPRTLRLLRPFGDRGVKRFDEMAEMRNTGRDRTSTTYFRSSSSDSECSGAVGPSGRYRWYAAAAESADSLKKFPVDAHGTHTPSPGPRNIRVVSYNMGDTTPDSISPKLLNLAEPGPADFCIKAEWGDAGEEEPELPAAVSPLSAAAREAFEGSESEESCSSCSWAGHDFQEGGANRAATDGVSGWSDSPTASQSACSTPQKPAKKLTGAARIPSPDILAIAVQEAGSIPDWEKLLEEQVGNEGYSKIAAEYLMHMHLVVYARSEANLCVTDVHTSKMPTGIGKMLGNKGGVAVSMLVDDSTRILFVNSHLAAHQEFCNRRNSDFASIRSGLFSFGCPGVYGEKPSATASTRKVAPESPTSDFASSDSNSSAGSCAEEKLEDSPSISKRVKNLFRFTRDVTAKHDVTLWCGDLNYRVDQTRKIAEEAAKEGNFGELCRRDQLTRERTQGRVFKDFEEGSIGFPPTFKLDPGTDNYDTSKKKRVPSWTDRILYRIMSPSAPGTPPVLQQLTYDSVRDMQTSDHRPVFSDFVLTPAGPSPPVKKRGRLARRFLGPLHRLRAAFCAVA